MARVLIRVNPAGVRELLRSDEVKKDLEERAARIAQAAGEGFEYESEVGPNRARAVVITTTAEAMLAEAQDRTLTRSIDAGR